MRTPASTPIRQKIWKQLLLYALIELLNEKGLLIIEELDERKRQAAERLVKKFVDSGLGLMYRILNTTSTLLIRKQMSIVRAG